MAYEPLQQLETICLLLKAEFLQLPKFLILLMLSSMLCNIMSVTCESI